MNSSVREKMFALVVIIALGVVFVPMLFTQNKHVSHQVIPEEHPMKVAHESQSEHRKVVTLDDYKVLPKPQEERTIKTDRPSQKSLQNSSHVEPPPSVADTERHVHTTADPQPLHEVKSDQPSIKENKVQQSKTVKNVKVAKKRQKETRAKGNQKTTVESSVLGDFPLSMVRAEEHVPYANKVATTPLEPKPTFEQVKDAPSKSFVSTQGWAIQMATFSQEKRAHHLKKQLEQDGYPTYMLEKYQGNRKLTQVMVGPYAEKYQAQQLQQILQKTYLLQSLLVAGDTSSANKA